MKRVFLDANVLFSAAYREQNGLLRLWIIPHLHLLSSHYAAKEAEANLGDPTQRKRLARLLSTVTLCSQPSVSMTLPTGVKLPPKDEPILLAAIYVRANALLTGDVTHFGPYFGKTIAGVHIMRPATLIADAD